MRLQGGRLLDVEHSLCLSIGSCFGSIHRHWVALVQIWLCKLLYQQVEHDRYYLCRDYSCSANNQIRYFQPANWYIPIQKHHEKLTDGKACDEYKNVSLPMILLNFVVIITSTLKVLSMLRVFKNYWKSSLTYIHMHQINSWFPRILELLHSWDFFYLQNPMSQIRQSWRGRIVLKYREIFVILT